MSLKIGIVGLPNVGKSTLFNALLKSDLAEAANYAFTTIDPNVGVVEVPDERLSKLAEIENSEKVVPTTIQFVDIAGLIAGASKGEGLGNKFLAHIRETDAIIMVVRMFADKDVVHVSGDINPKADIETIKTELILADLETLAKRKFAYEKESRGGSKVGKMQLDIANRLEKALSAGKLAHEAGISVEDLDLLDDCNLMTTKPFLYVFNVDEDKATDEPGDIIHDYELDIPAESAVVISAQIEAELGKLDPGDQADFLNEYGLHESGLHRLVKAAYKTLNLVSFLTAGVMESRAWTVVAGSTAPQAAGVIHTDFEKKFIKAEISSYDDFVSLGGWVKAKAAGKVRLEGKDYLIQDGDVCYFKVGA